METEAADIEEEQAAIDPQQFIEYASQSMNLAAEMDERQLQEIAQQAISDYEMDKESMSDWFDRMKRGLDLANLVKEEEKTYPFDKASNVKYPLVTSAALQFNARSYPAIVAPDRIVMAKVWGNDPQGTKAARADRISEHMSWQLSSQVEEWEEETDKLLVQLPIVGEMFRKWWYDPVKGRPACRLVDSGKFIVNDKVKSLTDAPRCTEELPLYPNEIESRIRAGEFVEFEYDADEQDKQAAQEFIEQHTRIDLDEDGYSEPYVVTVHIDTQKVVRIVADYRPEDVRYQTEVQQVQVPTLVPDPVTGAPVEVMQMQPQEVVTGIIGIKRGTYFVPFQFLPSMDGGFHGTGLGLLLGDISDSINTIINMMLDAGHYASLGGGFIGSEFRLKGGSQRHRPGEWKMVTGTGNDVRNAIVPMTFPGPDATLFQMLGLLIDAGREIASVKDVVTGEQPRQQQTATTTLALIEQGMMVFTAAYKRIFRSLKREYKLLANMNAATLDPMEYSAFHDMMSQQGQGQPMAAQLDPAADYNMSDMDVQPVADPRSVTKMQQAAKAQFTMQLAEVGLVDRGEALNRIAEAMDIEDVEKLRPQPDPIQQQMAMMGLQAAQADLAEKAAKIELTMAQVEETRAAAVENMANASSGMIRAANEQTKIRLDSLMKVLEEQRARMEQLRGSAAGMERQSGNAGTQGGNGQGPVSPQGVGAGGLLEWQPGAGIGPFGPADGGTMGGGLF